MVTKRRFGKQLTDGQQPFRLFPGILFSHKQTRRFLCIKRYTVTLPFRVNTHQAVGYPCRINYRPDHLFTVNAVQQAEHCGMGRHHRTNVFQGIVQSVILCGHQQQVYALCLLRCFYFRFINFVIDAEPFLFQPFFPLPFGNQAKIDIRRSGKTVDKIGTNRSRAKNGNRLNLHARTSPPATDLNLRNTAIIRLYADRCFLRLP